MPPSPAAMPLGRLLAWLATLGASRGVVVRTQPGGEALEGGLPCDPWQNRSTGELFCKPGFLVLGCQRCGTSSLYRAMTQHRQIKYTGRKDTFFWKTSRPGVDLARERCNTKDVDSYLGLFKDVPAPSRQGSTAGALTGEFSGTLFGCACCAAKLRDILPQAKMVVMLREPMGRAESRFRESVRRDNPVVKDSTWSAYREAQVPKLQACLERAGRDAFERTRCASGDNIFGWSLYDLFLQNWVDQGYSPANFQILYLDDWSRDPLTQLRGVETFLGIQAGTYDATINDVFTYDKERNVAVDNNAPGPRNLAFQDKGQQELMHFYKDSVHNLRRLCQEHGWIEPPTSWEMKGSPPRKLSTRGRGPVLGA
mmetsp:Transcript_5391/g.15167  ORF Transcript_5391/g.15167 Transcript_5391/m.15167 type:complete len:368 (-) Transcript_5391:101-1204(-)